MRRKPFDLKLPTRPLASACLLCLWLGSWLPLDAQSPEPLPEVAPAVAEEPAARSLLWKIETPGQDWPASYLYGTIHIIPKDSFFLPPGLESAMAEAEQLVMELPLEADMGAMLQSAKSMLLPAGTKLKDLLTEEDYAYLQQFMRDSVQTPVPFYQMIKPIFTLQQLSSNLCHEGEAFESYELYFAKRFEEMEKPVSGLETMAEQLAILDSIPLADQAQSLMETVRAPREGCEELSRLIHLYRQQDLEGLMALTTEDPSLGDQRETLLDSRNRRWIARIDTILAGGASTLIAVGAGHLAGPEGVIQLLQDAGYTLSPVLAN